MITAFNRFEKKFVIDIDQANHIKSLLDPFITQDQNNTNTFYTICNIYYDTETDEIIKRSISKPIFKEKLRLRCYGSPNKDSIMFLEIKKKLNGFVNKRRTNITLEEAHRLIFDKVLPIKKDYHNTQVLNEIYFYVLHKKLIPKISINYDREAFFSINDPNLRITFDFNITSRRDDLMIGRQKQDTHIIDKEKVIMEIKTTNAFPLWLTTMLNDLQLYSNSFSKYGTEFYDYLITNRKDDQSCLNPYLTFQAHQ